MPVQKDTFEILSADFILCYQCISFLIQLTMNLVACTTEKWINLIVPPLRFVLAGSGIPLPTSLFILSTDLFFVYHYYQRSKGS